MNIETQPWSVPNYISAKVSGRLQAGFIEAPKFQLCDVDVDTLSEQCDMFRVEVFRKAGKIDPKLKD